MRDLFDELIEVISQMWERTEDPEITLEDVALPLKAAMIISEAESLLMPPEKEFPFSKNNKTKKRFTFGRNAHYKKNNR